jgi:hypothetical protein
MPSAVVVRSETITPDDPAFANRIDALSARLADRLPQVARTTTAIPGSSAR